MPLMYTSGMNSEALERAAKESRSTYVTGTPEKYPKAELRGFTILEAEALLAEVARLEQERDEAHANTNEGLQWLRDDIAVKVETIAALEAALAVAREREQRVVDALTRIAHGVHDDCTYDILDCAQIARVALVGEPAAAIGRQAVDDYRQDLASLAGAQTVASVGQPPAAATLAEEGGRASNRAADAPSLAGWSSVGGAPTEPSDCAPSSASAAADEPAHDFAGVGGQGSHSQRSSQAAPLTSAPEHSAANDAAALDASTPSQEDAAGLTAADSGAAADEPGETP